MSIVKRAFKNLQVVIANGSKKHSKHANHLEIRYGEQNIRMTIREARALQALLNDHLSDYTATGASATENSAQ